MNIRQDRLATALARFAWIGVAFALLGGSPLLGAVVPVTDENVLAGLSPYNWVCQDGSISTAVNGAAITVQFKKTRHVALRVETLQSKGMPPTRFPIIAWSVNGTGWKTHQLAAEESEVALCDDADAPRIELYLKGFSPFEDRFTGDVPRNSAKFAGFVVDEGGASAKAELPSKIWLNIGDSIMSGDGAALAAKHGRPANDAWAASDDGRASYGYLLASHFGYRESRIAYGGYDWGGGLAAIPALTTLIDMKTSTVSRLDANVLNPAPDVVLINLGENGAPAGKQVTDALQKLRSRVKPATRIIVMVPVSGRAREPITHAFNEYRKSSHDEAAYLLDAGPLTFPTCDGQHPTAAGHQAIYQAILPRFDAILRESH